MEVDPVEVDRLLVKELNQLSFNDRERVMEEVHGVSAINSITDNEEALICMQNELDKHYYSEVGVSATHGNSIEPQTLTTKSFSPTTDEQIADNTESSNIRNASFSHHNRNSLSNSSRSFSSSSVLYGAYREARSKNSLLLSDTLFQRAFLVTEDFDPKRAALRLMKYLEFIRELYETSDVLFRPIFIEDLHMKAKEQLVMGCYQMLPDRDSSGRRIFVYLRDIANKISGKLQSQVYMYFAQKLVDDSDGVVCVTFLHNSTLFSGNEDRGTIFRKSREFIECLPARFHAIHLCLPDKPFNNLVKSAIMMVMGTENRYRVRIHIGSHLECHYSLATFGIPVNRLPMALDLNTTLRKDNISYHKKWLRMQKAKEDAIKKIHLECCRQSAGSMEQIIAEDQDFDVITGDCDRGHDSENGTATAFTSQRTSASGAPEVVGMTAVSIFRSQYVEYPRHEDCLFGRGRSTMKHPGNVAMRNLLDGKRDRYASAAHQKKSEIAWEVLKEIKIGGGRFLKELDTGLYTMVDDETARKKISIAFRDSKDRVGKMNQRIQQKEKQQNKQQKTQQQKQQKKQHQQQQQIPQPRQHKYQHQHQQQHQQQQQQQQHNQHHNQQQQQRHHQQYYQRQNLQNEWGSRSKRTDVPYDLQENSKRQKFMHDSLNSSGISSGTDSESECFRRCF